MTLQLKSTRKLSLMSGLVLIMASQVPEVPSDRGPVINDKSIHIEVTMNAGSIIYDVNDENSKCDRDADGNNLFYLIVGSNSNSPFGIDENTGELRITDPSKLTPENKKAYQLIVYADNGTNSDDALITIDFRKQ